MARSSGTRYNARDFTCVLTPVGTNREFCHPDPNVQPGDVERLIVYPMLVIAPPATGEQNVGGVSAADGFTILAEGDSVSRQPSLDGSESFTSLPGPNFSIAISLKESSLANTALDIYFRDVHNVDRDQPCVRIVLTFHDLHRQYIAEAARINRPPDSTAAAFEDPIRTWIFLAGEDFTAQYYDEFQTDEDLTIPSPAAPGETEVRFHTDQPNATYPRTPPDPGTGGGTPPTP